MERRGWREAAVLVLISEPGASSAGVGTGCGTEPDILLTRRALTMRSQPGQMSFPGGTRDPGETPIQTALREANEEIGLDPTSVRVDKELTALEMLPVQFIITPVLATWDGMAQIHIANPAEVHSIHRVPVSAFADPDNRVTALYEDREAGPGFALGEISVWGFTARVIDQVLRLRGWAQPWDLARMRAVPEGFR